MAKLAKAKAEGMREAARMLAKDAEDNRRHADDYHAACHYEMEGDRRNAAAELFAASVRIDQAADALEYAAEQPASKERGR
jgi:regulator of protease activity HflC (stomatin/prohibitin superfamily)